MSASNLKVLSYNIHKGYSLHSRDILHKIRDIIRVENPDLLFLQEIEGSYSKNRAYLYQSQVDYLAQDHWPHFAYGKNVIRGEKNHGNAILSKWPLFAISNIDISENSMEQRGLLLASIELPKQNRHIQLACTHLNLLEKDRRRQVKKISKSIQANCGQESSLLLAGDFNDWQRRASSVLEESLATKEIIAKSYPSFFPILALDRIYYRKLHLVSAKRLYYFPWVELSDHLPLLAEFSIH